MNTDCQVSRKRAVSVLLLAGIGFVLGGLTGSAQADERKFVVMLVVPPKSATQEILANKPHQGDQDQKNGQIFPAKQQVVGLRRSGCKHVQFEHSAGRCCKPHHCRQEISRYPAIR